MLAFALSAPAADGAESFDLQASFDQSLEESRRGGAPSIGSGFHVAPGKVVTAAHVIAGCHVLWVRSTGTSSVPARIVAIDARADIAVLDAPGLRFLPTLPLADVEIGAPVTMFGFPKRPRGVMRDRVATPATVEAFATTAAGGRLLMLRGIGTEGISGGPVVDASGAVTGTVVAKEVHENHLVIAVATAVLKRFLDHLEIETTTPTLASTEGGQTPPIPREKPRRRTTAGTGSTIGSVMPEWTSAVMQVGCAK